MRPTTTLRSRPRAAGLGSKLVLLLLLVTACEQKPASIFQEFHDSIRRNEWPRAFDRLTKRYQAIFADGLPDLRRLVDHCDATLKEKFCEPAAIAVARRSTDAPGVLAFTLGGDLGEVVIGKEEIGGDVGKLAIRVGGRDGIVSFVREAERGWRIDALPWLRSIPELEQPDVFAEAGATIPVTLTLVQPPEKARRQKDNGCEMDFEIASPPGPADRIVVAVRTRSDLLIATGTLYEFHGFAQGWRRSAVIENARCDGIAKWEARGVPKAER